MRPYVDRLLEANEGDLPTRKSTRRRGVRGSAHELEDESVQRSHGRNEHVSAPSCDHVEVKCCSDDTEQCAPSLQGFNPADEREHEEQNGSGFVIVGTRYDPRQRYWGKMQRINNRVTKIQERLSRCVRKASQLRQREWEKGRWVAWIVVGET